VKSLGQEGTSCPATRIETKLKRQTGRGLQKRKAMAASARDLVSALRRGELGGLEIGRKKKTKEKKSFSWWNR